jgi:hypothetical protein
MDNKEWLAGQVAATKRSLSQRPEWMKAVSGFEGYRYQEVTILPITRTTEQQGTTEGEGNNRKE